MSRVQSGIHPLSISKQAGVKRFLKYVRVPRNGTHTNHCVYYYYHPPDIWYCHWPLLNLYTPQQSKYKMDADTSIGGDSKMSTADNSEGKIDNGIF